MNDSTLYSREISIPTHITLKQLQALISDYFTENNFIQVHEGQLESTFQDNSSEFNTYLIKIDDEKLNIYSASDNLASIVFELENYITKNNPVLDHHQQIEQTIEDQNTETEVKYEAYSLKELLIPHEGFWITPILTYINVAIFIIMVISGVHIFTPTTIDILDWGGNFRTNTVNGEWWRLLTANFIHIGIMHLLFNMYALLNIGIILEPILGKSRFLFSYIICAFGASLASLWWNDFIVSAGASGAIFGMYGLYITLIMAQYIDVETIKAQASSIFLFVGFNIFYGLLLGENIDNAAHIGGLMTGMLIGFILLPSISDYYNKVLKWSIISSISIVTLFFTVFMLQNTKDDIGEYENIMMDFEELYNLSLEVYPVIDHGNPEHIVKEIDNRGLYYLRECIKVLEKVDALQLPKLHKEYNTSLKALCLLQIEQLKLYSKKYAEDSYSYNEAIMNYDMSIDSVSKILEKYLSSTSN